MNALALILLATTLATLEAANSTTIRGSTSHLQIQGEQSNRRRHLLQDATCTLFRKCVTYPADDEHPNGYHTDTWVCELSKEDTDRLNVQFVDIVESQAVTDTIVNATSGKSKLSLSEAVIDTDAPLMYIPENAQLHLHDMNSDSSREDRREERRQERRQLVKTQGTLKTLVIRLTDRNNISPTLSTSNLKNDIFDDSVSLKSQTEACSYGKLKIEPFKGNTPNNKYISNGVVDVSMDYAMASGAPGMDQAAMAAANKQLGDLNDDRFGLIMFCFPPGSNFLAFAFPNSKYSFYNDKWCGYVTGQMHEVGHNIGLAHSGQTNEGDYGDGTGLMGSSSPDDDRRICYNPQKNYQLGWYDDKVETIDPLDGSGNREFTLNGVSDYKMNNNALIVIRLRQLDREQDYYVGFNRAEGINAETYEDGNRVTIVRKEFGSPLDYGQSTKIASLNPGEKHVINNFNGKKDVQIMFLGLKNGDAQIMVLEGDGPPPTSEPGSCQKVTVEITTDDYPKDTYWYIADTGGYGKVAGFSQEYTQANRKHSQTVCLPMGSSSKTYQFTIMDKYGDGMCCSQGNGSYNVIDNKGGKIFSGGSNFSTRKHYITVQKDPSPPPPTKAPTSAPTPKPTPTPPCEKYVVEVRTDKYPKDTSWEFSIYNEFNDAANIAKSPEYTKINNLHKTTVCLPQDSSYEFRFFDSFADGICCSLGEGYFRLIDSCGKVVIDSGKKESIFSKKVYNIYVDNFCPAVESSPTSSPIKNPTLSPTKKKKEKKCKNKHQKKFSIKLDGKNKTCKQHATTGKCDKKIETDDNDKNNGKYVWKICKKSCEECKDD